MVKLPPLKEVDPDLHLGHSETTELKFQKCKHELYIVSSTEARCKNCSAGWSGSNIIKLVEASNE